MNVCAYSFRRSMINHFQKAWSMYMYMYMYIHTLILTQKFKRNIHVTQYNVLKITYNQPQSHTHAHTKETLHISIHTCFYVQNVECSGTPLSWTPLAQLRLKRPYNSEEVSLFQGLVCTLLYVSGTNAWYPD